MVVLMVVMSTTTMTIRYDKQIYLTCVQTLTGSQLSLPHDIKMKTKMIRTTAKNNEAK